MKYSGNVSYSLQLWGITKHIMIGPMPPEPVHFISQSQAVFSFFGLEVNSSGKTKFSFHFEAMIIIILTRNFMLMVKCSCFHRILNKLTPDKFEKLCHELLGVGIETKYILKGVILLVS